ncbi:MAG: hypothetical protein H8E25_15035, partial [Planctomycetes bacterium]|nr:hypothetical protein [Planctomycetota bacterium]
MTQNAWRVELELLPSRKDPLGGAATATLNDCGLPLNDDLRVGRGYLLPPQLSREQVDTIASRLLADKVNEVTTIVAPDEKPQNGTALLVRRMAGVSDPEAETALRALALLDIDMGDLRLETYRSYRCLEDIDADKFLTVAGSELANLTIEEAVLSNNDLALHPTPTPRQSARREVALLNLSLKELENVSREMSLALTGEEMKAVQDFFIDIKREPTDAELETLAQTWSEHCKHKTLTGPVDFKMLNADGEVVHAQHYDNLLKETVFAATQTLSPEWCWSVFKDNAGVIAMTDDIGIAVKVETHNHPSALDPYGGAGTRIGGGIPGIPGPRLGARPFVFSGVFFVGAVDNDNEIISPGPPPPQPVIPGGHS